MQLGLATQVCLRVATLAVSFAFGVGWPHHVHTFAPTSLSWTGCPDPACAPSHPHFLEAFPCVQPTFLPSKPLVFVLVSSRMLSAGGVMNCTCLHALKDYRDPTFTVCLLSASHVSIDI